MPKRLSEALDGQLLLLLAGHSSGVGIDMIATAFQHLASKRALQRRLTTHGEVDPERLPICEAARERSVPPP